MVIKKHVNKNKKGSVMKYIKKDKFKNTKHCFRGKRGNEIIITDDIMEDNYVYEKNKFMFDILEEVVKEEVVIEKIDEVIEKEIVISIDPAKLILDELKECSTIDQIIELANENDLDLDGRIKNVMKLKENFKEELDIKI